MADDWAAPPLLEGDPHDRELRANTHPLEWQNPTPKSRYGLVVVGGGTAGLVSAGVGAILGAKVALIERAYTGGDCLVTGCVPSKSLLRAARAAADVRRAGEFGIRVGGIEVDFAAAMERMRRVRATISRHDAAASFRDTHGVDVFFGNARFIGPERVDVDGQVLRFRRAILATGARAAVPPIPGLAAAGYYTNETIFNLTERPPRLAVIGGGPLGCEMAQAFARLGSQVTVLQRGPRLLPHDDPEAATTLARVLEGEGLRIDVNASVERVTISNEAKIIHVKGWARDELLEADAILVATGRAPNVAGLNLESAQVRYSCKGVEVDDYLRTSNRQVFAAGDVCLKDKFTHTADASARVAVQNALLFPFKRWSRQVIPHVTYTDPEIAQVGLHEGPAAERNLALHAYRIPLKEVDRAVTDADQNGYTKIYIRKRSNRIAGATVVGRHAGEMISQITSAMRAGLKLQRLSELIFPYPTESEAFRKIADEHVARSIHGWMLGFLRWFTAR